VPIVTAPLFGQTATFRGIFKDSVPMYPWKSNHHLLKVGFRTTIILVGIYHLPKGTTIFKMVVDFQMYGIFLPT